MSMFDSSDFNGRRVPFGVSGFAWIAVAVVLGASAASFTWMLGSSNPYTPAGYVGYLTRGAVFGRATFIGIQRGPTSAGRSWLLDVANVSITPYTYTDAFSG